MLPASKEPDSFTLLTVALVLSKHSWMDMDSQPTSSLVGLVRASEKVRPGTRQCTPRLRRRRRPAGSSPGGARLKVTEIGEEERRGERRGRGRARAPAPRPRGRSRFGRSQGQPRTIKPPHIRIIRCGRGSVEIGRKEERLRSADRPVTHTS